ncbi:hypothetical protein B0O99DRAFT_696312 [Bisporella sp. PMI_857]|nr:hypothetical protein B0O99DRAFT_696312 [Bisporella sp. PMI_857]
MPYRNTEAENSAAADSSLWAERIVLVIGAATGMGQAVVTAFAAAGAHRIALVDSGDTSVTQDRALQAAAANHLAPPDLLILHLQREDSASLEERVEEVSRKWGHVDFIINHADHRFFFVEHRVIADKWGKCFESGFKNGYALINAFLPLLLVGSEKTLINIIPASSPVLKPGVGANIIVEMANRQMADCLMVDHGHEGLLAYSIHSSRTPTKGIPHPANQDHLNQLEPDGNAIVYLTTKRREWLAGRHISSTQNARELVAHKDVIVRDDLLKYKSSLTFELPPAQVSRGRVSRSSY